MGSTSEARRQGGFTLVELAFAGVIAAGLSLVALELLLTSLDLKLELEAKVRTNHAARQSLSLLADGGAEPGAPAGTDGSSAAHGVRSRAGPAAITLLDGEIMQIDSNGLTVTGDRNSPVTVTCTAAGDPLPACTAPGDALTLDGALAADPALQDASRSVGARTVEIELLVRDPWGAARNHGQVERYGGIHIYNAEEGEGAPGTRTDVIGGGG